MKKIFLLSFLLFLVEYGFGQTDIKFDPEVAKQRVKDKVEDYQYQLNILASTTNKQTSRNIARDAAKNLFMKQGGYYNYPINNQTYYDKCEMETVNKYRPNNIYHKLVKTYLDNLAVRPYNVSITATKDIVVDGLKKIGNNQWMAVAHIGQKWISGNLDRPSYSDITFKDITVFIDIREDEYGVSYIIRLEDCKVTGVTDVPVELQ
jgi:hypothetical protein